MSENKTINPAEVPQVEKSKSLGIKKIEGKEVFITGYAHTRGQPTQYTPKEKISEEDGKTDYWTIQTEEAFDLDYKEEGVQPVRNFFITEAVASQIERIPNYESVNSGGRIGPVKAIKRASEKNVGQEYWCLAFSNDKDY